METMGCSYGADDCPKINDCYRDIRGLEEDMSSVKRILYIIVGIVVVELGILVI